MLSVKNKMSGAYILKNFESWSSKSWADLKNWLQSAEGGALRIVDPKDSRYAIIRYEKGTSKFDLPHVNKCRSVVIDKKSCKVVSIAPVRAEKGTDELVAKTWRTETFVDGTMVSVFLNGCDAESDLVVTTRSRIGAQTNFEGKKSFAEQFKDAVSQSEVDIKLLLNTFHSVSDTDESVFATFVLAHPDNRIVTPVAKAHLTLVQMGWVNKEGQIHIEEDPFKWGSVGETLAAETVSVTSEELASMESIRAKVQSAAQTRGYGWQGLVLKNGEGVRIRIRSDLYQVVRRLRGNENTAYERFARLRAAKAVTQYLAFYPEDSSVFYELEGLVRSQTRRLSNLYGKTFIKREQPYHELPWPFKYHVSVLHNLYKDTLKSAGKTVDLGAVIQYVNGLKVEDMANLLKPMPVHVDTPSV